MPKATLLEGRREVMEEGVIGIILLEDTEETVIHAVDKSISKTLGEPLIACKRAHQAHHVLVICVHRNTNMAAVPVKIVLLDMAKGSLGLVCVSSAIFGKNRGTDLMTSKLEDLVINLQIDLFGVSIRSLQIEV